MKAGILLVLAVVVFRIAAAMSSGDEGGWLLANFSPVGALVLCGAMFFPGRLAWAVPVGALLVTEVVLNLFYGYAPVGWGTLGSVLAWGMVFGLGWRLRGAIRGMGTGKGLGVVMGATFVSALMFYVVTNTVAFIGSPYYPQSLAGWWQSLTVGVPGFPPTLVFFRNSLIGDAVFTSLFLVCVRPWASGFRDEIGVETAEVVGSN